MDHGTMSIGMGSTATTTTTFIGRAEALWHAFAVAVSVDDSNETTTASFFIATTILGDSIETSNCSNFNANSLTQNRRETELHRTETLDSIHALSFLMNHLIVVQCAVRYSS